MDKPSDDRMVPAAYVKEHYGGVSNMWIHRRLKNDPTFPRPRYIGRLRYWFLSEIIDYDAALPSTTDAPLPFELTKVAKHRPEVLPSKTAEQLPFKRTKVAKHRPRGRKAVASKAEKNLERGIQRIQRTKVVKPRPGELKERAPT